MSGRRGVSAVRPGVVAESPSVTGPVLSRVLPSEPSSVTAAPSTPARVDDYVSQVALSRLAA